MSSFYAITSIPMKALLLLVIKEQQQIPHEMDAKNELPSSILLKYMIKFKRKIDIALSTLS
ncbi:MAG TPA: hypothetical protein DDY31_18180 [Lachnospiraceae bacterium]|nr:hypothetical protein [Lachnospiraceae bacterium]